MIDESLTSSLVHSSIIIIEATLNWINLLTPCFVSSAYKFQFSPRHPLLSSRSCEKVHRLLTTQFWAGLNMNLLRYFTMKRHAIWILWLQPIFQFHIYDTFDIYADTQTIASGIEHFLCVSFPIFFVGQSCRFDLLIYIFWLCYKCCCILNLMLLFYLNVHTTQSLLNSIFGITSKFKWEQINVYFMLLSCLLFIFLCYVSIEMFSSIVLNLWDSRLNFPMTIYKLQLGTFQIHSNMNFIVKFMICLTWKFDFVIIEDVLVVTVFYFTVAYYNLTTNVHFPNCQMLLVSISCRSLVCLYPSMPLTNIDHSGKWRFLHSHHIIWLLALNLT